MWHSSTAELRLITHSDATYENGERPSIRTETSRPATPTLADYVLPGATIKEERIAELKFTRAAYERTQQSTFDGPFAGKRYQVLFIGTDGTTRIEILCASSEDFDSLEIAVLEEAARSFRRVRGRVQIAQPTIAPPSPVSRRELEAARRRQAEAMPTKSFDERAEEQTLRDVGPGADPFDH